MAKNRVELSEESLKSYLGLTNPQLTDSQGYEWFNLSLTPKEPIIRSKKKPDSNLTLSSTVDLKNLDYTLKQYIKDKVSQVNKKLADDPHNLQLPDKELLEILQGNDVLTILNTIKNSREQDKQLKSSLFDIDKVLEYKYFELFKTLNENDLENKIKSAINTSNLKRPETRELSSINLEKEFIYYIAHKINVFNKTLNEIKENSTPIADKEFNEIILGENGIIQTIQNKTKQILKNASLTQRKKNEQLDELRVELTKLANEKLKDYFGLPNDVDANIFSEKFQHNLENTPSFLEPITIIQINPDETVDVFSSAKNSAHEYKNNKDTSAQLSRYRYDNSNLQLLYNTYRTDILVPHPDTYGKRNILQRLGFNKSEIEIKQLQDTLIRISNICSKGFTEDEPVFYNLFTSVPYPTDIKEPKNQQTARVKILLKAQDDYNKNLTEDSKKYFLTLNIPTNGFGYPPSPYSISSLARELSLRNDMAIAMILGSLKEQDKLMNPYKTFLQSGKIYIKDSEQAQSIRDEINNIKNKQIPTCDSSNAFKCTLQLIYQNNLHYTHEFTLLTQTMALLCEEQSINGCKSGNERTAQILGRVEQGEKLKDKIIEVMNMHHITPQEKARFIASELNALYNEKGIYGITTDISLSDQGAVSKIKTQKPYLSLWNPLNWMKNIGIFFKNLNSNLAEPSTIDNIQNSNTGDMQAHKLNSFTTDYFINATQKKTSKKQEIHDSTEKQEIHDSTEKMEEVLGKRNIIEALDLANHSKLPTPNPSSRNRSSSLDSSLNPEKKDDTTTTPRPKR